MMFIMDFMVMEENILEKLTNDGRIINYKNLFFKTGNSGINSFDFLKRFGTLFDLLIDLLNEKMNIKNKKRQKTKSRS